MTNWCTRCWATWLRPPAFLQTHLPQGLNDALNWPTLKRLDASFIDEAMRGSEADLLYEVERVSGEDSVWLYLLIEHQSSVESWMRLRLLNYCCRIWEMQLGTKPMPKTLRPIVPLVFYQGERAWSPSTEFADLFAESVRDWPWVPRFTHELIDQSSLPVEAIEGEVKVRIMQLLMLAAYHRAEGWMEQVTAFWESLSEATPRGGLNYIQVFVLYILSTQEPDVVSRFGEMLERYGVGDDVMTYAQQLLEEGRAEGREEGREAGREEGRAEGREEGKLRAQVDMIEDFLREGVSWSMIKRATGFDEVQFETLKQQVKALDR